MSITPLSTPTATDIGITAPANALLDSLQKNSDAGEADASLAPENQVEQASFADVLSEFLPEGTSEKINEEQLFSAILAERIEGLKGSEGLASFQESFEKQLSALQYANGYIPVEDAARAALKDMVNQEVLSLEEAESIHAQAFQAAQLDDNPNALYDSLGTTMAVAMVEMALESSTDMLTAFDSGEKDAGRMSLDYRQAPDGGVSSSMYSTAERGDGPVVNATIGDGFLFKPISEKNGNLAVLLPKHMSGDVSEVTIRDSVGQTLDRGSDLGDYDDGRPLFRFGSPGSGYPENITVSVLMHDGTEQNYTIPHPAQRYE